MFRSCRVRTRTRRRSSKPPATRTRGWRTSLSTTATPTGRSSTPTRTSTGPTRGLQAWVERDLASAKGATWRFVAFHHPGFTSAREHYEQQQMRHLAGVFEAGKADIVFSGHVHNYQRSYPLHFIARPDGDDKPVIGKDGKPITKGHFVTGRWRLDKSFDGVTNTRADGVIYLVTGAGGQHLYNPEQQDDPASWQGFTHKFVSKVNSLTVADVDGPTLTIRQVSADGQELDRFVVTK